MNITPASHKVKTKFTALFLFVGPAWKNWTHYSIDLITLWAAATTISSDSVFMRSHRLKDNKLKLNKSAKVTCSDLESKLELLKIFESIIAQCKTEQALKLLTSIHAELLRYLFKSSAFLL